MIPDRNHKLRDALRGTNLEEQTKEYVRIMQAKIRDHEEALQYALDMLDAIQKGKK